MTFNTERALAVANAIRNAPPDSFDMRFYYDVRTIENPDEPDDALIEVVHGMIDSDTNIVHGGLGPCGSVGCIAGWTVSIYHDELLKQGIDFKFGDDWEVCAADLLGLDDDQASSLFMGRWFFGGMSEITNIDAANQLEYLVSHYEAYGTVDL